MAHEKLIQEIRKYPRIWDRNHPQFRDRDDKDSDWTEIGKIMGYPGATCRELYKSLREKYLREREKAHQTDANRKWELLNSMQFLDSHILPRKQSYYDEDRLTADQYKQQISSDTSFDADQSDFNKSLIALIKQTTPIWDRNCSTYPNKQLKSQLWHAISSKLNRDVEVCLLRWKALREKYIREKKKCAQGLYPRWSLLEDMAFLDRVILYRRKQSEYDAATSMTSSGNSYITVQGFARLQDDEFVKTEAEVSSSGDDYKRKVETYDDVVDVSPAKAAKVDFEEVKSKSPEELFGELVARILSKKTADERNMAMVEIMTILSK